MQSVLVPNALNSAWISLRTPRVVSRGLKAITHTHTHTWLQHSGTQLLAAAEWDGRMDGWTEAGVGRRSEVELCVDQ